VGTLHRIDIASYIRDSLVLGHHQRHQGLLDARTSPATLGTPRFSVIASDAGDSLLLGARTSPVTPGTLAPRCSDIASDAGDSRSLALGHRQRRWRLSLLGACTSPATSKALAPRRSDIVSDAGDSSFLSARTSPATPGTPRSLVLGHRQRHRGLLAPRCSDIASDAGDSSLLGARTSPATLGTLAP